MARQLSFPQGDIADFDPSGKSAVITFDLASIRASKAFAKLRKAAPEKSDDALVNLIIMHIAEGVE